MSGNKKMALIKRSPKIEITIYAPIFNEKSECNLHWETSRFSKYGQNWNELPSTDHELFTLKRVNETTLYSLNVRIFARSSRPFFNT